MADDVVSTQDAKAVEVIGIWDTEWGNRANFNNLYHDYDCDKRTYREQNGFLPFSYFHLYLLNSSPQRLLAKLI